MSLGGVGGEGQKGHFEELSPKNIREQKTGFCKPGLSVCKKSG